jgi:hypothetical protein
MKTKKKTKKVAVKLKNKLQRINSIKGKKKTAKKKKAARANGKKGGRPKAVIAPVSVKNLDSITHAGEVFMFCNPSEMQMQFNTKGLREDANAQLDLAIISHSTPVMSEEIARQTRGCAVEAFWNSVTGSEIWGFWVMDGAGIEAYYVNYARKEAMYDTVSEILDLVRPEIAAKQVIPTQEKQLELKPEA